MQAVAHRKRRGHRRKRRGLLGLLVVLLILALAAVPLVLWLPDAVERLLHPLRYEDTIRQVSRERGLEPTLVASVVYNESRFDPEAVSDEGAVGLMQILPETARFIQQRSGIEGDYRDPEVNLRLGAWYLSYLEDQYEGHERLMLAAYNSGQGRVNSWVAQEGFDIERDIPFPETRHYVENVLESQQTYTKLYGRNLNRD